MECILEIGEHVLKHPKEALAICIAFLLEPLWPRDTVDGRIHRHGLPNISDEEAGPPINQEYGEEKERGMGLFVRAMWLAKMKGPN